MCNKIDKTLSFYHQKLISKHFSTPGKKEVITIDYFDFLKFVI